MSSVKTKMRLKWVHSWKDTELLEDCQTVPRSMDAHLLRTCSSLPSPCVDGYCQGIDRYKLTKLKGENPLPPCPLWTAFQLDGDGSFTLEHFLKNVCRLNSAVGDVKFNSESAQEAASIKNIQTKVKSHGTVQKNSLTNYFPAHFPLFQTKTRGCRFTWVAIDRRWVSKGTSSLTATGGGVEGRAQFFQYEERSSRNVDHTHHFVLLVHDGRLIGVTPDLGRMGVVIRRRSWTSYRSQFLFSNKNQKGRCRWAGR